MAEIYYESEYEDEHGVKWLSINGDTHYSLEDWSKEEARADYLSPESETERTIDNMRAWGFYD